MRPAILLALVAVLLSGEAARTGLYTTTFSDRHPDSPFERLGKRYGWGAPRPEDLYDVAKEEFEVNVPSGYDGSSPWGLIVYINSGKGSNARAYADLLAKHRLIWIGAMNVPNERAVAPRWGLALDAAWNMRKRYAIDPRRIYVCGFSGGGRCASELAPTWPEVFSGGIYLCGCNPPRLPSDKALAARALDGRYAFLTGSGDFNQKDTQGVHGSYKGSGFKHTEYFEQPGLAHATPSVEWFEKGLVSVDRPLVDEAVQLCAQAKAAAAKKPYEAARAYRKVLAEYPIAEAACAEARAGFEALVPAVEALLRGELAKLGDAPPADRILAFAVRAEGFPCASEARTLADAVGAKELAGITAQPGAATAGKLEKFLGEWAGYPCAATAAAAYDGLAAKALEPIAAQADPGKRDKALAKFLKDWDACSSRMKAVDLLEGDLSGEVDKLVLIDKPAVRAQKLAAFAKAWSGTQAAARAESELSRQAAPAK